MKLALHNYFFCLVALTAPLSCVGAGTGNQARTATDVLKDFSAWVSSGNQSEKELKRAVLEQIVIEKSTYQIAEAWIRADRDLTSNAVAYEAYDNGKKNSAWTCIQYLLKESKNNMSPSVEAAIFTLDDILKETFVGWEKTQQKIQDLINKNVFGTYYTSCIANKGHSFLNESVYLKALQPKLRLLKNYLDKYCKMTVSELKENIESRVGKLIARLIKARLQAVLPIVTALIEEVEGSKNMARLQEKFYKAMPWLKLFQEKKSLLPRLDNKLKATDMLRSPKEFNARTKVFLDAFDKRIKLRSGSGTTRGNITFVNTKMQDSSKNQTYKERDDKPMIGGDTTILPAQKRVLREEAMFYPSLGALLFVSLSIYCYPFSRGGRVAVGEGGGEEERRGTVPPPHGLLSGRTIELPVPSTSLVLPHNKAAKAT